MSHESHIKFILTIILSIMLSWLSHAQTPTPATYGISMHGQPMFGTADSLKLTHVNPAAPKGGTITQTFTGTFDSLNPYIVKGTAATFIRGNVVESLMARAMDEPFTLYGLIAQSVEMADDRSAITFNIHPQARFSDGAPITTRDVDASFNFLKTKGRPNYRSSFQKVETVEVLSDTSIRFAFPNAKDRELPLILGLMPVFPKTVVNSGALDGTTLAPFVASGPYVVAQVKPGQQLILQKNPKYWGANLQINQGLYNFDTLRIDYYRDNLAAFETFKAGRADVRYEEDATRWRTGYQFDAALRGEVVTRELIAGTPRPMNALVFNTRRAPFDNIHMRRAMVHLFNFEWMNANLFGNAFTRTTSFFEGSELSSIGVPVSLSEQPLLAGADIPTDVLAGTRTPAPMDISGKDRAQWTLARKALELAGYVFENAQVMNTTTRQPLTFEMVLTSREQEKNALAFQTMLQQFGILAQVRMVDSAQFERRRQNFEFDMMPFTYASSLSPGNEQVFRWASKNAHNKGSFNLAGVQSPHVDAAIAAMLSAQSRPEFVEAVHALDRLLIAGSYVVPLYTAKGLWLAHWQHIGLPARTPLLGFMPEAMWAKRE